MLVPIRNLLLFFGLLLTLTCAPVCNAVAGPPMKSSTRSLSSVDSYRLYRLLRKHPHLARRHPELAREMESRLAAAALPRKLVPVVDGKLSREARQIRAAGSQQTDRTNEALVADLKTAE